MKQHHPAPLWSVLAALITSVLITGLAWSNSQRAIHDAERAQRDAEAKWCELVRLQDDVYRREPPPSETGKEFARVYRELRAVRCP